MNEKHCMFCGNTEGMVRMRAMDGRSHYFCHDCIIYLINLAISLEFNNDEDYAELTVSDIAVELELRKNNQTINSLWKKYLLGLKMVEPDSMNVILHKVDLDMEKEKIAKQDTSAIVDSSIESN